MMVRSLGADDGKSYTWRIVHRNQDPALANQATQSLQVLDTMRMTLLSPDMRRVYDQGIGLGGQTAGLADPSKLMQGNGLFPTPPRPQPPLSSRTTPSATAPTGLWACYKCQADNPNGTQFCFKCGAQRVRACPECGSETSLVATGMCGRCGSAYDTAIHKQALRAEPITLQQELLDVERQQAQAGASPATGCLFVITLALGSVSLVFGLAGSGGALIFGIIVLVCAALAFHRMGINEKAAESRQAMFLPRIEQIKQRQQQVNYELEINTRSA